MKNRILMLWVACLTMYVCITTNDIYTVLRNVETGQYFTMKYMEKSANILSRLKRTKLADENEVAKELLVKPTEIEAVAATNSK